MHDLQDGNRARNHQSTGHFAFLNLSHGNSSRILPDRDEYFIGVMIQILVGIASSILILNYF